MSSLIEIKQAIEKLTAEELPVPPAEPAAEEVLDEAEILEETEPEES